MSAEAGRGEREGVSAHLQLPIVETRFNSTSGEKLWGRQTKRSTISLRSTQKQRTIISNDLADKDGENLSSRHGRNQQKK